MYRHRTKIGLSILGLLFGLFVAFANRLPSGDQQFLRGAMLVCGLLYFAMLWWAPLVRCPRCGDDLGYFYGIGPFRKFQQRPPQFVTCKQCGCVVDRWNDSQEVG